MKYLWRYALAAGLILSPATQASELKISVSPEHWVSTWATAQQLAPAVVPKWAGPPPPPKMTSPIPPIPVSIKNQTIRMIVRTTVGGPRVRVQFSNSTGSDVLSVGTAHLAFHSRDSGIVPGSDRALTFGGNSSFTVVPGAVVVSDPLDLAIPPYTELAISMFVPVETPLQTVHSLGLHTSYIAEGDATSAASMQGSRQNKSYFWLADVEVLAPASTGAIVAFGDSITDGFSTTPDAWHEWPSVLAKRFGKGSKSPAWSVLNLGISGNRLRRDGAGLSALARFDRDVLSRSGVRWIVLLEGINDINFTVMPGAPEPEHATTEELIEAYGQVVELAHLHGIKIVGATVMPCEGLSLFTEKSEAMRLAVNQWIRTSGKFDRVVDLDAITRDPLHPSQLRPAMDSGDHIHPNDAGNAAMANAFELSVFKK